MLCMFLLFSVLASPGVVITEIMYNPDGQTLGPDSLYEWVELQNLSDEVVSLGGMILCDSNGAAVLDDWELGPGQWVVVAAHRPSFVGAYGREVPVVTWTGDWPRLSNRADVIILTDRHGVPRDTVAYTDQWGARPDGRRSPADGVGSSLEKIAPAGPNVPENWAPSVDYACPHPDPETGDAKCWGTPGAVNSVSLP